MVLFNIYFSSCVLLLLTLNTHTATGHPLPELSKERCSDCSVLFKNLLLNITQLLNSDALCFGIPSNEIVVRSITDTLLACTPNLIQNPHCMMQRNATFNETECLSNIMKDLAHYAAVIQSYLSSSLRSPEEEVPLLSPTLGIIQSLRKSCSLMPDEEKDSSEEEVAQLWGDDSYRNRQEMCKMMRGFYVRTITINRAVGYIASGEHRK
ncbi:interleukin-12 subunit alpha [Cheilinus undulatus]|uniref:interleukin-12 subunit alpha n=1 Tax=Cheilinus undulatus TaxID=241271 RepID=UPI001BD6C91D|nr:interleukin-12 subunit alpha [Cheilinus undulatus]